MNDIPGPLPYRLTLMKTEDATGYFACVPPDEMSLDECIAYLKAHPNDVFMRQYVLERIGSREPDKAVGMAGETDDSEDTILSLLYEASLLSDGKIPEGIKEERLERASGNTPFIYLRSYLQTDHELHKRWIGLFRKNINEHQTLPAPDRTELPFPYGKEELARWNTGAPSIETIRGEILGGPLPESPTRPAPAETARKGLEKLERLRLVAGELKRHVASLSPVALLRQWHLDISVKNGRHDYTVSGIQTAYGRGVAVENAMASYVMEMVERRSAFASFSGERVEGYQREHRLVHGTYSNLSRGDVPVLDPNTLALEAPYNDEPLYWIEAEMIGDEGHEPILVPAQCVFLFCNLDEIKLFSGLGSTGLASGNSVEEAKVNALLEIIERDHEGVTPFDPGHCFTIETRDESLYALLEGYRQQGIHIRFQDLTSPMGIPCCKCFVIDTDGNVIKGAGAHLDAGMALLSAMTETPFPYPSGPASAPGLDGLTRVPLEKLPSYSTGNISGDLNLLERIFSAHGFRPIYIDLTRKDIDLPVVRAIVPGMEITGDFEWYSRVHPRLFSNYLRMHRKRG